MDRDTATHVVTSAFCAAGGAMSGCRVARRRVDSRAPARLHLRRPRLLGRRATASPRRSSPTASGSSARSFKYHRPRGIWGAWREEPNAIVDVRRAGRTTPNVRATTDAAGRRACGPFGQRRARPRRRTAPRCSTCSRASCRPASTTRPSSGRAGRRSSRSSATWPASAASIPTMRPPADSPQFNAHCDVLVVGAGPAGLAAARGGGASGPSSSSLSTTTPTSAAQLAHRGGACRGRRAAPMGRKRRRRTRAATAGAC